MQLIGKPVLQSFKEKYADAKSQTDAWQVEAENAIWRTPYDIKQRYSSVSIIGDKNVVFNIKGNKYRIWVKVAYQSQILSIIKAGTHKEYDSWDIR